MDTFSAFFSSLALICLLPFFIPIVLIPLCTVEREIFYLQKRIGKDLLPFNVIKLVTMRKGSASIGTGTLTIKNDPRVLPFGKLLCKTKIKELPQLINILLGDMSVIGPRSLTEDSLNLYSPDVVNQIKNIRLGLSGIGSIVLRGEEGLVSEDINSLDFYKYKIASYKGLLQVWYVKNVTLKNYFKAKIITLVIVFIPKSRIVWTFLDDIPTPPDDLKFLLNYKG
jgi:lipopolysaccharide/colanic/teichoic acid biosynthesis glycosyltransferase